MGRGLSQDLRDRVVAAIDGGMSCRGAAVRFGVSAASAIGWRQLSLRHGTPAAKAPRWRSAVRADRSARCLHPWCDRDQGCGSTSKWDPARPSRKRLERNSCKSASKARPHLLVLTYSKTVPKAAKMVEIGAERSPQPICDSRFVPTTCGRIGRGPPWTPIHTKTVDGEVTYLDHKAWIRAVDHWRLRG